MIYKTGDMVLNSVRDIFRNDVNDIIICRDSASPARPYYVLAAVKERETAKALLAVFENNPRDSGESAYIACFSHCEQLCYLFDYHIERSIAAFGEGQITSHYIRENVCINIVLSCLSSPLPYPLLYLLLDKAHINIQKDNSIFFTPYFDLSRLDPTIGESACAVKCVRLLIEILQRQNRKSCKSLVLLEKRVQSRSYKCFTEVYRDIKITAIPEKKPKLFKRLRAWWGRNKDILFKIILVMSVICVILALSMLLSYLIFGDSFFSRLFGGSIDQIGTEPINIL
jgi:hypothetical protein